MKFDAFLFINSLDKCNIKCLINNMYMFKYFFSGYQRITDDIWTLIIIINLIDVI